MSRNPSGSLSVEVRAYQNDQGAVRVIRIQQDSLEMLDLELLMGILVHQVIRLAFDSSEETVKLYKVIVDLGEVRRMNIEIVAAFTRLLTACTERDVLLRVCSVDSEVQKVLDKTPIARLIVFMDTLEEAFGS